MTERVFYQFYFLLRTFFFSTALIYHAELVHNLKESTNLALRKEIPNPFRIENSNPRKSGTWERCVKSTLN